MKELRNKQNTIHLSANYQSSSLIGSFEEKVTCSRIPRTPTNFAFRIWGKFEVTQNFL